LQQFAVEFLQAVVLLIYIIKVFGGTLKALAAAVFDEKKIFLISFKY